MIRSLLLLSTVLLTGTPALAGSTTLNWDEARQNGRPAMCRVTYSNGQTKKFPASVYTTTRAIYIGDNGWDVRPSNGGDYPLAGRHTSGAPVVAQWGDGFVEVVQAGDRPGQMTTYICEALG